MTDLNTEQLLVLNGGGFSYDVGCAWRYAGHYAYGYICGGGITNSGAGHATGTLLADATKC